MHAYSLEKPMVKPPPQQTVQELLSAILDELRLKKAPQRLWSMDDIAAYLNKSKITIQQRVGL